MKSKLITTLLLTAGFLMTSLTAQAQLYDRGSGLIYDNVLNVTWLQDANYAKTSGYDTDGLMSWNAANEWASTLTYGGYGDWRLPNISPIGTDWNYTNSYIGESDNAYNITSPNSELSYMYYVNLGLKGQYDSTGAYQYNYGIFSNGTSGGQANVGLVQNLQSNVYWSGSAYAISPNIYKWNLDTVNGYQGYSSYASEYAAWAVRDGDVTPVPEPEICAMMLLGIGMLGFMARCKNKSAV